MDLYKEDMKKVELLQKKQAEEKAKKEAQKEKATPGTGASVEEIDEDEAMKIELENLRKKQ